MRTRIFAPAAPTTHHHHLRHTKKINRAWWFQFRIRGCAGAAKVGSAAATRPIGASWAHPRAPNTQNFPLAGRPRPPAAGATQAPANAELSDARWDQNSFAVFTAVRYVAASSVTGPSVSNAITATSCCKGDASNKKRRPGATRRA
jgi:hypothetical protein